MWHSIFLRPAMSFFFFFFPQLFHLNFFINFITFNYYPCHLCFWISHIVTFISHLITATKILLQTVNLGRSILFYQKISCFWISLAQLTPADMNRMGRNLDYCSIYTLGVRCSSRSRHTARIHEGLKVLRSRHCFRVHEPTEAFAFAKGKIFTPQDTLCERER